eukprot:TRINITY_DN2381_c0_g1_i11.p1 TRINITY_DN2381_c0_g1~~TRINITY_DN2381_c0_g1_i11.p1  ORF type:complete len:415 (-),score=75.24 TRINITY_DN2381_c0_g1_i11:467-1711(-)
MENSKRKGSRGFEANVMAILDSAGVKEARDLEDDRHSFLEAVQSACLMSGSGSVPTRKVFEAIFQILKDDTSLELKMASYQLLRDLEKRFPQVHLAKSESSRSTTVELVVVEEAWSPFVIGWEGAYREEVTTLRYSHGPLDSHTFFLLMQDISQAFSDMNSSWLASKLLADMLLFQYLVNFLEGDFIPRQIKYKETMSWAFIKDSMLHMLLAIAVPEVQKGTHISMMKFFVLIMELDVIKKEADTSGLTSRADGTRTPLLEIVLDELTYNKDLLSPFLQAFSDPKWKLEITLQYFWKYCTKPSVRTRRSNSTSEDGSFDMVLKCFSNSTGTRNVVRKISTEVSQLLLAHAFQAYLSLKHNSISDKNIGSSSLEQICTGMISAFNNLKNVNEQMEMMPFGKEALFTAATILSAKS